MPSSDDQPTPDRSPRMEARRQAMLDAAAALFFEQGYERVSLGAVVRRSGGSLSTLYQLFGSKEGLFEAMITQRCAQIMAPLTAPDLTAREPRETLRIVAHAFLDVILCPEAQALWRTVMGQGQQFPRLPEIYFRCGPDQLQAAMARYLACLHDHRIVHCPEPMRAAQAFCVLTHGDMYYRVVTGTRPPPDADELARHIDDAVGMFLAMLRPPGS